MSAGEKALAIELLYWRAEWDDSNPNVGFGVGFGDALGRMLDGLVAKLPVTVTPDERKEVVEAVHARRRARRR